MRFGPTSLQVSSVLAKGLKRPKLRTDLRISEQTVAGEISYVVKNRETNSYNRYGATEYQLLSLCDGTRTAAEIAQVMSEKDPDLTTGEADVLDFLDSVESTMWERSVGEKNLAVLERIRDERGFCHLFSFRVCRRSLSARRGLDARAAGHFGLI